jgi:hypothetical protein
VVENKYMVTELLNAEKCNYAWINMGDYLTAVGATQTLCKCLMFKHVYILSDGPGGGFSKCLCSRNPGFPIRSLCSASLPTTLIMPPNLHVC